MNPNAKSQDQLNLWIQLTTEFANQIVACTDLNDLYRRVVTLLHRFGFDALLLRRDPTLGALVPVAGYGKAGPLKPEKSPPVPIGSGVAGKAASINTSVLYSGDSKGTAGQLSNAVEGLAIPIKLGKESVDAQLSALRYFIDNAFDGFVVAAIEVDAIAAVTRKALDKEMSVVSLTSDLGAGNQTALVWAVEHDMGHLLGLQAGDWAKRHLPAGETLKVGIRCRRRRQRRSATPRR